MTKLEEMKAARDAACDNARAAVYDALAVPEFVDDEYVADADAWKVVAALDAAAVDACDAYEAELKKTQKENSDG